MDWFGLPREAALRLGSSRVVGKLFTPEANVLASALVGLEEANMWPQRIELEQAKQQPRSR